MEKVYRTMRNAGACSIVIGSVMIVTGLAAGKSRGKSVAFLRDFSCNTLFGMEAKSERRKYSRHSREAAFQIEGNC